MRIFEKILRDLRAGGASRSDNRNPKWDPNHCLDTLNPALQIFLKTTCPAFGGAWGLRGGLGLPVRVLILGHIPPVGSLIVRLVARGQILNRIPIASAADVAKPFVGENAISTGNADAVFHRLHAVLAEIVGVRGILAVAATRAAGLGAGGFFVVAGGAHAHMIPERPAECKPI